MSLPTDIQYRAVQGGRRCYGKRDGDADGNVFGGLGPTLCSHRPAVWRRHDMA